MNFNQTCKQKTFSLYFLKESVLIGSSEEVNAKYMKEDVLKSFFRKLADWHLTSSLRINFFTNNIQGFWLNEHLPVASNTLSFLYNMPKKYLGNSFLLYILPEILQVVHEISSFRVFCKKVFCQKGVLKNFPNFPKKKTTLPESIF